MKSIVKISILVGISFLALKCQTDTKVAEEKKALDKALMSEDSLIMVFQQTLNEIDHNLEVIREKEGVIVLGPSSNADERLSSKERILRNIEMINTLMAQNREKVENLEKLLANSNQEIKELKTLAINHKSRIKDQEERIDFLKKELENNDFTIEKLNNQISELQLQRQLLEDRVQEMNTEINKAYLAMGTFRELKDLGIAEKEGGILWLGRTKSLNESAVLKDFSEIDIRETQEIPLYSKDVELISEHPEDSYELEKKGKFYTQLKIKKPEEFWKVSNFLVIEIG